MRGLLRLSSLNQRLSATPTHAANQSTPLMPAQPKNAKQPACNRRGLRSYRALYPDVVDDVLDIGAT